jgi:hypothetical protein
MSGNYRIIEARRVFWLCTRPIDEDGPLQSFSQEPAFLPRTRTARWKGSWKISHVPSRSP